MKKKNIKVCQVASADISLRFLTLPFMKDLQKHGFEVWGVCSPGKWVQDLQKEGIEMRTFAITRRIFTPFSDALALFQLFRLFRRERFDIVHTHTLKASFLGHIAAFFAGVPIKVYTCHGLDFAGIESLPKKILFGAAEYVIARITDVAFFVNEEDTEYALRKKLYSKKRILHIPVGVDLGRFDPERFPHDFVQRKKQALGIPSESKVIGIVARLVREKGYFELFEAFSGIVKKFPDVFLIIVGSEEPEKSDAFSPSVVRSYHIEKNTLYLGERTDVEELYAIMDVFALPSHRESLSLASLEASAMNVPVVATAIRGFRESVDDGKTGILVPVRDPLALEKAMERILIDKEFARRLGTAGREKVKKEYDKDVLTHKRLEVYEKLIAKKLKYRHSIFS